MACDKILSTTLVFAPHPDDEVLGAGGTIIKKTLSGERVIVCVVTGGESLTPRKTEVENANRFMGVYETVFLGFPDLGLDMVPHREFTDAISEVIQKHKPDEVYTPHPGDLHTDHKTLTAAVMVALRPKYPHIPARAYTYETLSETGWDFQNPQNCFSPNVYVDISDTISKKLKALSIHRSQLETYPGCRCKEAIENLSIYRGTQSGMEAAEAFSVIRRYEK